MTLHPVIPAALLACCIMAAPATGEHDPEAGSMIHRTPAQALFAPAPISGYNPSRSAVMARVSHEAQRQAVPVRLAQAVAHVESRHRCEAIGPRTRHGRAQGPLQILPSSAAALGYSGALANCETGLVAGMAHLAKCYSLAGTEAGAATCHVQGWARDPHRPVNLYARAYVAAVLDAIRRFS